MRTTKSVTVKTVEIELNQHELSDLHKARQAVRSLLADSELPATERKAMEDAVYLISTVLGNHE